jgi:SAM-dependent methyltransferase
MRSTFRIHGGVVAIALASILLVACSEAPAPATPQARERPPAPSDYPDLTIAEVEEMRDAGVRDAADIPRREPDILFVPTPQPAVDAMLDLAGVGADDVVYDLGSGDGRIPITAARRYGACGVGVDIDPVMVRKARANAGKAGVADRVTFREEDIFETEIAGATVVSVYLLESLNVKLKPRFLSELRPGTRIVGYEWRMGDWSPDRTVMVNGHPVYLWVVPPRD